jgi:pimeloyl-ACP methyl ester carboxylesterase
VSDVAEIPVASRVVRLAPVELRVSVRGEGPPVVLVPAGGRPATDYDVVARELAANGFRAVAVNMRGVGGSTGPLDGVAVRALEERAPAVVDAIGPSGEAVTRLRTQGDGQQGLTLHDLAADVAGVIEDIGGPAHVVGHAIGQRIVRCLAADRPELVRTLTLLASGNTVRFDATLAEHLLRSFLPDITWEERLESLRVVWFAPESDPERWREGWHLQQFLAFAAASGAAPDGGWLTAGTAPILVIQGLEDRMAPPENGRALVRELGSRCRLVELPGVGHALLPEQPETIARHLIEFLRAH